MQHLTGYTNCANQSVTSQNLMYWFNSNKIVSKYINFETFPTTRDFEYQSYDDLASVLPGISQVKTYNIQKTGTWINDNWFSNKMNSLHYNTYAINYPDVTLISSVALNNAKLAIQASTGRTDFPPTPLLSYAFAQY